MLHGQSVWDRLQSKTRNDRQSARLDGDHTLRIGVFSESFHPVQNGVTTSVLTLVKELRALEHRVWIFAPEHEQQAEHETNVLRFPSFVSSLNPDYPLAYPFLPRLALTTHFSRLRLDVVHTHTPFVLGLTGANLAVSRGVPLISTFHTLYSQYSHYMPLLSDSVTQNLLEYYLPWYYNRCSAIICPSTVAADALRAFGVERCIEVIPTGIPLPPAHAVGEEAAQSERLRIGIPWDAPLLLYAGRLSQEKNVAWLLEAFDAVQARVPDARLVIAGGGPIADELQQDAARRFSENAVLFLGPLSRDRMDPLFAAADVFCFPSPSETQGLVIGEARAAGTPCVVVDAGGAPETVRDGEDGFRVPAGDTEQFAQRVTELLLDKAMRAALSENARRNAREYTPERMVCRVMDTYVSAIQQAEADNQPRGGAHIEDPDLEAIGQSMRENPRRRKPTDR